MTTYIVHFDTGDDENDGVHAPLQTIWRASELVGPGDRIEVRAASVPYTNNLYAPIDGRPGDPILVYTLDGAVLAPDYAWRLRSFWQLIDLNFRHFPAQAVLVGRDALAEGVLLRGLSLAHGRHTGVQLFQVKDTVVEGCSFLDIRSGIAGDDTNALEFKVAADNVAVRECVFRDIGSDGIHVLPNRHQGHFVGNITIDECEFYCTRPYGSEPYHILGNAGENGIDVKQLEGPLWIRDCYFVGFRPTTPGQDASGSGSGAGVRIHDEARNVVVESPTFVDCTTGIKANPGSDGQFVGPITVTNPRFIDVPNPMVWQDVTDLEVIYEEAEPPSVLASIRETETALRVMAADLVEEADGLARVAARLAEIDDQLDAAADLISEG